MSSRRRATGFYRDDEGRTRPITPPRRVRIVRRFKTAKGFDYRNPRRVKPMLAGEGGKEDLGRHGYVEQRKFDGTRVVVIKDGDRVILRGRSWKNDFARRYPEIVREIQRIPVDRFVADAELTFFRRGTEDDEFVTALASPETRARYDVRLMVFDVLYSGDESVKAEPFTERQRILKRMVPPSLKHIDVVETVEKNQKRYYRSILKKGAEGAVLKEARSPYREGRRTSEWLKVKEFKTDDAVVVGVTKGKGSRAKTFGSLILAKRGRDGRWRHVGNASGFTEEEGRRLLERLRKLKVKKPPLDGADADVKFWTRPEVVVEVKYFQRSKNGKYRFPDFTRVRDDKTAEEV